MFLHAIVLGAALGAYYDVLRAVRRQWRLRRAAVGLLDGLYWLVTVVAVALFVLIDAGGNGRSYVILGLAGGAALYFLTLSGLLLKLWAFLLRGIDRAARLMGRLLAGLCRPLRRFRQKTAVSKKVFGKHKKPLPFFRKKV